MFKHSVSKDGRSHTVELTNPRGEVGKLFVLEPGEHNLGRTAKRQELACFAGMFRWKGDPCVVKGQHGGVINLCRSAECKFYDGFIPVEPGEEIVINCLVVTICMMLDPENR